MVKYFEDSFADAYAKFKHKVRFSDDSNGFGKPIVFAALNLYSKEQMSAHAPDLPRYNRDKIGRLYLVNDYAYARLDVYLNEGIPAACVNEKELKRHFIHHFKSVQLPYDDYSKPVWQWNGVTVHLVIDNFQGPENAQLAQRLNQVPRPEFRNRIYDATGRRLKSPNHESCIVADSHSESNPELESESESEISSESCSKSCPKCCVKKRRKAKACFCSIL